MNVDELVRHATALRERIARFEPVEPREGAPEQGAKAQVCEFLGQYAGKKSAFAVRAESADGYGQFLIGTLTGILDSYIEFIEAGLDTGVSVERQAQLDVVSDFLGQAQSMLDAKGFHPAAAAVLVGAALEEFLRNWVEADGVSIGNAKPSIDAYAKALKSAEQITKQDVKDITSWAGIRNHAAHGEWDEVSDPHRIRLMLEGVNFFMRQKT